VNEQHPNPMQQIIGQVRSLFYLVDEPTTILSIQLDGQLLTARAAGQIALDLRALPRGATICAMLHDTQLECAQIIAFTVMSVAQLR
jgi:hypothetical protein